MTTTTTTIPTIDHPTDRPNFTRVEVAGVWYWFSYSTCVAVSFHDGRGPIVRVNEWGPTTGKHLNYIDGGKGTRVDRETFATVLSGKGVSV